MTALLRLTRTGPGRGWCCCWPRLVLSSCGWRGISNVSMPGGPGTGSGSYTVLRADAGHAGDQRQQQGPGRRRLRRFDTENPPEELGGHADPGLATSVKLPKNATAKIGQTSLLGSQHIELAAPTEPVLGAADRGLSSRTATPSR